jgi:hypothetical protein
MQLTERTEGGDMMIKKKNLTILSVAIVYVLLGSSLIYFTPAGVANVRTIRIYSLE